MIKSQRLGQTMRITMAPDGAAVMDATFEPGARVPLHRHLTQDEHFEVEAGEAKLRVGGRTMRLRCGESVDVPAGVAHAVRNAGTTPLQLTARLSPGLRIAEFFADLFAEADAGHVTAGGVPSPGALGRLARVYGDELPWLPALPLPLQRFAVRGAYRLSSR